MSTVDSDTIGMTLTVRLAADGRHRITVPFGNGAQEADIPLTPKLAEFIDKVLVAARCKPAGDSPTSARIKSDADTGFLVCTFGALTL